MANEKTTYRELEGVGEIWMEEDGTYSYRTFEFGLTDEGIETVYRAQCKMETRWMTEAKRRAGQLEGYESPRELDDWYGISAASYLTGMGDNKRTKAAIAKAMKRLKK